MSSGGSVCLLQVVHLVQKRINCMMLFLFSLNQLINHSDTQPHTHIVKTQTHLEFPGRSFVCFHFMVLEDLAATDVCLGMQRVAPTLIGPDWQAKERNSIKGWRKNRGRCSNAPWCSFLLFKKLRNYPTQL